ncbi:MAG: hypothetical protein NXI14_14160 [bacterium]|nr:hypothetical protein [bacterium]
MKKLTALAIAVIAGAASTAVAGPPSEFLVVPDSSNDILVTFSPFDGSLINSNFATIGGGTPKHALQVGNEIWVSNQLTDQVDRFTLNGAFVSSIVGGLDNIKGMEVVGNEVWVTNAGSNNGAPGNSIVKIDIGSATISGSSPTSGSLFDVINYQGQVLGTNITSEDLEFYDAGGNFASVFHASDGVSGIDFPQQAFARDNGGLLVAGFSPTSGVYAYDAAGNDLGIVAGLDSGARGVYELGNGNIMWTNGAGVWVTDPNTGQVTQVYDGGSSQYIDLVVIPAPGAAGLLALAGFASTRRRR